MLLALSLQGAEVQRIVSTAPSITETLFAMGLGERVVGVTIYCKYPPAALKLPKIGTYLTPDVESILALHPDLVVVQKQSNHLSGELARLHIAQVEVDSDNLSDVYAGARAIGKAAHAEANAERFVQATQAKLEIFSGLTRHSVPPSAVFIVGPDAGSLDGLIAGAGKSYFSDLLTYARASNAFSDAATPYPTVSMEELLSRNPDVIMELGGDSGAKRAAELSLWNRWPSLKAVKTGHVYVVEPGPFLVPGPRVLDAVRQMTHLLHPEIQP